MPETQVVRIQCPNCGAQYETPIRTVIDVGQDPQLRQALLSGQLNLAICPKCNQGGVIEAPLVYHDPQAEFLAVYFPPQVQISELERQRMIGELTQEMMRNLPPDQRKGYFLNPRQFMNRQNLLDAVLGTMGISQEELDRQRKKLKLIDQLMVMADDRKGLEMMMKGQDAQFDYEFFALLSGTLSQAESMGDQKLAERMGMLYDNLLELTTYGRRVAKQQAAVESLQEISTPEQLVDKIVAADPDEINAIAFAARPLLDYAFFQKLTERLEASQGAERDRLTKVRDRLLDLTQKLDAAAEARVKQTTDLLQELLNSPSPRSAVRDHIAELDETFMALLSLNMQNAERQGRKDVLQRLMMIYDEIMSVLEEGMPPEVQLVNDLLRAPYPDGTRALLRERQAEVTPEVLDLMDRLAVEAAARSEQGSGGKEEPEGVEVAKRLRDIKAQAMLLV
jgi:CpXC protein